MVNPIATKEQQELFQKELEKKGVSKVRMEISNGVYSSDSWKYKMAEKFLKTSNENAHLAEDRKANKISWIAIGISILALIIAIFK